MYVRGVRDRKAVRSGRWSSKCGPGLPGIGLDREDAYVMRHTFASIMDNQGVDHQKIADMMGHRNKTVFERIYRHRLRPVVVETGDIGDEIWGGGEDSGPAA
jgi:integrase